MPPEEFPDRILTDEDGMAQALSWAARGMYTTSPNPRVGCVIVRDQRIVAAGFTQPAGQAHAEVHALQAARAAGEWVGRVGSEVVDASTARKARALLEQAGA